MKEFLSKRFGYWFAIAFGGVSVEFGLLSLVSDKIKVSTELSVGWILGGILLVVLSIKELRRDTSKNPPVVEEE